MRYDIGDLVHLHHKGRLTAREIVRSADAGKDSVSDTDLGVRGGDKGAHLRHQHDQRDLPHIGGLARHIRTCDDGDTVVDIVEQDVVRDEHRVAQERLHHGVAAVLETDHGVLSNVGSGIAVVGGDVRKRYQHVKSRDRLRRLFDTVEVQCDLLAHRRKQLIFDGDGALLCAEDTALELFELGGDIALAVCERLLADIMLGHEVFIGIGDFDIVAEHAVVADLQLRDTRLLLLLGFDTRKQ